MLVLSDLDPERRNEMGKKKIVPEPYVLCDGEVREMYLYGVAKMISDEDSILDLKKERKLFDEWLDSIRGSKPGS